MRLAHKYSYEKPSFDGADSLGLGDLALYGVLCAVFCYGAGYGLLRLAVFEILFAVGDLHRFVYADILCDSQASYEAYKDCA